MKNYKITIQYDGTDFSGWQKQKFQKSIQGTIEEKIKIITKEDVNLIGAGRTDAGAHAIGQVANFYLEQEINFSKFLYSLNSLLPESIFIKDIEVVNDEFHARFDAKKRKYVYIIRNSKNPFYQKYSYLYKNNLDIKKLNNYAKYLIGEHNFFNFCKETEDVKHYNCIMYNLQFHKYNDLIIVELLANRFIYGMIRTTIGTLLKFHDNNLPAELLLEILNLQNYNPFKQFIVPAHGLILKKVYY
jgi:tRNA pseudouridine38-40 synthase